MMTRFDNLRQETGPDMFSTYYSVVQELTIFAHKLESELLTSLTRVAVEPGYTVRMGQQFKVIVTMPNGFRDVLLRAYVPDDGYPVVLSFLGQEAEATDEQILLQHLYDVIPSDGDFQSRIRAFRALISMWQR